MTSRHSRANSLKQFDARSANGDLNTPSAIIDRISFNRNETTQELPQDGVPDNENELGGRTIFTRRNTSTGVENVVSDIDPGSNQGSGDDTDDDFDIGEVFEEIRQTYGAEEVFRYSHFRRRMPGLILGPENIRVHLHDIEESLDNLPQETSEESKSSCANCRITRKVENVSCLKKGQHIRFPGEILTFNLGRKRIKLYHHHAIVKRVNETSGNSVELVLIHFSKVDKKITINEATNTYNLENDEIDILDYQRPRYNPDTIVQRAESMVPKGSEAEKFCSYELLSCNCEHFATWCVVGEQESFQAKGALETIASILGKVIGEGGEIGRFVKRFLYKATEEMVAAGFNVTNDLPFTLLGATAFIYLIYAIAMTKAYIRKCSEGKMCKVCRKREIICLWASFGAFCVTSGFSYILVHFLLPLISSTLFEIPLLLVIILLSVNMQWNIGKVVRALLFPYACNKIKVEKLSQIKPGSMISYDYSLLGPQHCAIVTEKQVESDESEVGMIKFVHYGSRFLCLLDFNSNGLAIRIVKEDSIELNVKENSKNVKLIDCRHLKTFPPDVVVSRVKARIGETKWSLLSNRSDHLCFDALVDEGNYQEIQHPESCNLGRTQSKRKSSFDLGKRDVHLRSDLKIGHIVEFDRYVGPYNSTKGIVVWLEDEEKCSEQAFKMDLIVYQNSWAVRKKFSVNLKTDWLCIRKYHPSHCCSFDERVQRALQNEGHKCEFWRERSFLESCIKKS